MVNVWICIKSFQVRFGSSREDQRGSTCIARGLRLSPIRQSRRRAYRLQPDLAPRPGEMIIPPNGPNKFLPYDLEFHWNIVLPSAAFPRASQQALASCTLTEAAPMLA
jgi:hypothetical protein